MTYLFIIYDYTISGESVNKTALARNTITPDQVKADTTAMSAITKTDVVVGDETAVDDAVNVNIIMATTSMIKNADSLFHLLPTLTVSRDPGRDMLNLLLESSLLVPSLFFPVLGVAGTTPNIANMITKTGALLKEYPSTLMKCSHVLVQHDVETDNRATIVSRKHLYVAIASI